MYNVTFKCHWLATTALFQKLHLHFIFNLNRNTVLARLLQQVCFRENFLVNHVLSGCTGRHSFQTAEIIPPKRYTRVVSEKMTFEKSVYLKGSPLSKRCGCGKISTRTFGSRNILPILHVLKTLVLKHLKNDSCAKNKFSGKGKKCTHGKCY